jgi:hypothetical protein
MAQASAPIAVAAATATVFDLTSPRSKVCVGVIFYTAGTAAAGEEVAIGSGTRDIAVSRVVPNETVAGTVIMPIVGASVSANPAHNMKVLDLGTETARISIACAVATDPGTPTHYRIFVD